jgi:site-specific DNA-methyltransferase (adenine-specific)
MALMKGWGRTYSTVLFDWLKTTKAGKPRMGCGYATRQTNEFVLLGRRGSLKRARADILQSVIAPRARHSEKPEEVARQIERLYGDVRRIELFARHHRKGWTCWGDQLPIESEEPRREAA